MFKNGFRARDVKDGKWVYGYYVHLEEPTKKKHSHRIYTGFAETDVDDFFGDWHEIDPKTVCKFTGLYDKKDDEIYEGDVFDLRAFRIKVVYEADKGRYTLRNGIDKCWMLPLDESFCKFYEVVGNIYDNPELMKGGR